MPHLDSVADLPTVFQLFDFVENLSDFYVKKKIKRNLWITMKEELDCICSMYVIW